MSEATISVINPRMALNEPISLQGHFRCCDADIQSDLKQGPPTGTAKGNKFSLWKSFHHVAAAIRALFIQG
jgi:hypothetical protein